MFKNAISDNTITVNNPEIWRPILSIQDAIQAYVNAVEIDAPSGTYNVFSDNYQIKELAEIVKNKVEKFIEKPIEIKTLNIQDVRNYKVSLEKAKKFLNFTPAYKVEEIIEDLIFNYLQFSDFENDLYYNINTFKNIK